MAKRNYDHHLTRGRYGVIRMGIGYDVVDYHHADDPMGGYRRMGPRRDRDAAWAHVKRLERLWAKDRAAAVKERP